LCCLFGGMRIPREKIMLESICLLRITEIPVDEISPPTWPLLVSAMEKLPSVLDVVENEPDPEPLI
jgi:hypothetical protein